MKIAPVMTNKILQVQALVKVVEDFLGSENKKVVSMDSNWRKPNEYNAGSHFGKRTHDIMHNDVMWVLFNSNKKQYLL